LALTTLRIEPVTRIGGRFPDRPKDGRERETPKDTFEKALQDAKEAEDGRQNDCGAPVRRAGR
jgi:hypothetical protein